MQSAQEKPSVLLIEDEVLITLEICEVLTEAGYHVNGPANTASGAHFLLERRKPNVAIIDIRLRDGTSAELIQQLRRRNVPILVHSRHPQHAAAASGCQNEPWLAKPARPADLLTLLGRLCEPEVLS